MHRRSRKKKVALIGDPRLVGKLMPDCSRAKGWVRISFFSIAWFFFMIGLARPQIGAKLKDVHRKGAELMIDLDVSNSMLAQDYSPNRLERAKLAISRLVDKMNRDRIGLVVFAGQSFVQLPITADYVSAKIFLNSISTESVPVQGTAIGDAINTSVKSFGSEDDAVKNNRAIIVISDGENHEDDAVGAARAAAEKGIKVFCIGVGTPDGQPIPYDGGLLKDKKGNIVVTKLNEKMLEEIAAAGGGAYVRAGQSDFGLGPILEELEKLEKKEFKTQVFEEYDEQYMYFLAIALFFFLLEFLVGDRKLGKKIFILFLIAGLSGYDCFAQTEKKEVRKGNREFRNNRLKEAEIEYRKALVKDSSSLKANYNLGNTLYRLKDPASALKSYGTIADSVSRIPFKVNWNTADDDGSGDFASDFYHNKGNSYLSQKKYDKAIEAYKNSLRRNPGDMDTKTNLAYAQKMLKDQQNKNKDKNKNKQKQGQDKNKKGNNNKQNNNKDNKKQNKNQNGQDPKENKNSQNQKNKQGGNGTMSPQAAQQILKAMQDKENETREKVKEEKAKALKNKQKDKNW
jgi:Ca-activated chloride channel family protein